MVELLIDIELWPSVGVFVEFRASVGIKRYSVLCFQCPIVVLAQLIFI